MLANFSLCIKKEKNQQGEKYFHFFLNCFETALEIENGIENIKPGFSPQVLLSGSFYPNKKLSPLEIRFPSSPGER